MGLKDLIKKVKGYNKESNIELLERSYKYSDGIVKNKFRASRRPFITHYLETAYEAAELKLDDASIAAALMHGLINKGANKKDIKNLFGDEILVILEDIEKISEIKKNVTKRFSDVEALKNVLLVASKDIRALLIKLCDKVVNLRDLKYINNPAEKRRIAKEAMNIYAPLAYRLGIERIKSEIEDLSFLYLDEDNYNKIKSKIDNIRKSGETLVFKLKKVLEERLEKEDIKGDVQSRVKHIYSIYKKIIDRSYKLDDMRDIVAFRIIVKNIDDCYKALKIVHSNFRPIPSAFKDYIAMPKPNGYQSLHTSVVDSEGRIFEIQIRTEEMHAVAEGGIAAHFIYKKTGQGKGIDTKLGWLKQVVENKEALNNIEFFGDEIFVFTPKGKAIELPKGASVIDFAYYIHSDVGNQCMGANVNGNFVSLRHILDNGDVVEIIRSKTQKPGREWLRFARTDRARQVIRQTLREIGKIPTNISESAEETKKRFEESLLVFEGNSKLQVKIGMCCKPIPGDKIIGIKNSNTKLTVHKVDCRDIANTNKKKLKVGWLEKFSKPVEMIVYAKNREGLFNEALNSIKSRDVKIIKAKGKPAGENDIECSFILEVRTLEKLNGVMGIVKKIMDVKNVYLNVT